jgi:ubiquinone/menaquinone biosynthesis C-methylase UbiE
MHTAFRTWNHSEESLESLERRIHDGVPLEALHTRADSYVNNLYTLHPRATPKATDVVMEIGPGLGYIMEAVMRRYNVAQIIGLDVAPAMIEHAKTRLDRDGVDSSRMQFQSYDGITIPTADHSIDHIYSVACLQHVPKVYVYHLFSEMARVLRNGFAVIHLLALCHMAVHNAGLGPTFLQEIQGQLNGIEGHWLHYYSKDELFHVLPAVGAREVEVVELDTSLWTSFRG